VPTPGGGGGGGGSSTTAATPATTPTTTPPTPTIVEKTLEISVVDGVYIGGAFLQGGVANGCVNLSVAANLAGEADFNVPVPVGASVKHVDFRYFDGEPMGAAQTFVLYEIDQLDPNQGPTAAGTLSDNQISSPNNQDGYRTIRMTPSGADKVSDKVHYTMAALASGGARRTSSSSAVPRSPTSTSLRPASDQTASRVARRSGARNSGSGIFQPLQGPPVGATWSRPTS